MMEPLPASPEPKPQLPPGGEDDYAIGYGRPPMNTRFIPGRSGNPKGRPKGSQNMKTRLRNIFLAKVDMRSGNKISRVTRLEALLSVQFEQGIKGNVRAAQAAIAMAKELGAFDDIKTDNCSCCDVPRELLARLSDEELGEIIAAEERKLQIISKYQ